MTIAERGTAETRSTSGSTSRSAIIPTGDQTGDLIIILVVTDSNTTISTPTGYTEFAAISGMSTMNSKMFYKQHDGSEGNPVFEFGVSTAAITVCSLLFDDTNEGDWVLNDENGSRVASGTSITTASVTGVASSVMVAGFGNDDDETVSTAPTGMTEFASRTVSSIAAVTYFEERSAGAVTKSITWGGTAEELSAHPAIFSIPADTGTNLQINIGDVWKEVPAVQINIGDVWKEIAGMQINIGDAWKIIF